MAPVDGIVHEFYMVAFSSQFRATGYLSACNLKNPWNLRNPYQSAIQPVNETLEFRGTCFPCKQLHLAYELSILNSLNYEYKKRLKYSI